MSLCATNRYEQTCVEADQQDARDHVNERDTKIPAHYIIPQLNFFIYYDARSSVTANNIIQYIKGERDETHKDRYFLLLARYVPNVAKRSI